MLSNLDVLFPFSVITLFISPKMEIIGSEVRSLFQALK